MTEPIRQVALVVRDLDAAVRHWWDVLGVGPWTVYTLAPPRLRDCVLPRRAGRLLPAARARLVR